MYIDKPMQGHSLMQAIARVNREFHDKPGGLVVDYLGLTGQLKRALAECTESGGRGEPTFDTAQVIAVMLEKHGIPCDLLHGINWSTWANCTSTKRLQLLPAGQEHILQLENGKPRWLQVVAEFSRAFALCSATDEATAIRDDVSFFQALQAALAEKTSSTGKTPEQIDAAIRQLVSKAITTDGQVIDVFTAAGLPTPDISILSDQFLAELRGLKHRNVTAELLEKLLKDELKLRSRRNLVQSQVFSEKLKKALNAYHNRAIITAEVIKELIALAKELDPAGKRGESLGLSDDEVAFHDALAANDSAAASMGDAKLKVIAAELITQVKKSVTIDWTLREGARARIRVMVKRILNKCAYPPTCRTTRSRPCLPSRSCSAPTGCKPAPQQRWIRRWHWRWQPMHPHGHLRRLLFQRFSWRPGAPPLPPPRRLPRRCRTPVCHGPRQRPEQVAFAAAFLAGQPAAEPLATPEQQADAEYLYRVQLPAGGGALQVICWRRLPGGTTWHPRCGPMALELLIRRFLPGDPL